MVRELIHDPIFLGCKSADATADDLQIAEDLLETLIAHKDSCVGMAANMIGQRKRIIAFLDESGTAVGLRGGEGKYTLMLNPTILKYEGAYVAQESCLSLLGGPRKCKRYRKIKVQYQSTDMKLHTKTYVAWTAQIIQHEIDHCEGVLI